MNIPEKFQNCFNVHDHLKGKTPDEVKDYCQLHAYPAAMAMFNTNYDFNISGVQRSCNALGFKEIYHIQKEGKRRDLRGSMGSQHWTPMIHCYNEDEFFLAIKDKYTPIAVENNGDFQSFNIFGFVPPQNAVFIFGAESQGLTDSVLNRCAAIITIPSFGAIRSFNVSCTASIVGFWYRQFWH